MHLLLFATLAFATPTEYFSEIHKWQQEREQALKAPYGWLSVTALTPLPHGKHRVGSLATNQVVLPKAPCAQCAEIEVGHGQAYLLPTSVQEVKVAGKPVKGKTPITPGQQIEISRFHLSLKKVPDGVALRIWDPQSTTRKEFKGCKWFPVHDSYRVEATLEAADATEKKIKVDDITGGQVEEEVAGALRFSLKGVPQRILAFPSGKGLFIVFRDETSGSTSYGAGRFLNVEKRPALGGKVVLDFNKAFNPPCAFSKFTTCPLPPRQNHLAIAVEAGEQRP